MCNVPSSNNTGPSRPSSCPYYSMTSFALILPLAFLYTCTANLCFRLAAAIIPSARLQIQPLPLPAAANAPTAGKTATKDPRRVAIVTGSNTGIGFETARALVLDHNIHVILACRSRDKAVAAVDKINAEQTAAASANTNANTSSADDKDKAKAVFVHPLDLSSFRSVRDFCAAVKQEYPAIYILVNNAGRNTSGSSSVSESQSQVPLDLLFQSNFLGHYVLTSELLSADMLVPNARIVNLSSVMHHFCGSMTRTARSDTKLESVDYWKQCATAGVSPTETYSPSKLAAQLFTIELNRRYGSRLRSIAVNPGAV